MAEYVYFVQGQITRLVKIGSTSNFKARFQTLQGGSPDKLNVLKVIEGTINLEWELHEVFESVRSHGEWFFPSRGLIAYIESLEGKTIEEIENEVKARKRDYKKIEYQRIKDRQADEYINISYRIIDLWEKGNTKKQIAADMNMNIWQINKYLPSGRNPNYKSKKTKQVEQAGSHIHERTEILIALFLDGETTGEIAEKLNITTESVRRNLSKNLSEKEREQVRQNRIQKRTKVIYEMRINGASWKEISKEIGLAESTTKLYFYRYKSTLTS